jgi:hypothetical protein
LAAALLPESSGEVRWSSGPEFQCVSNGVKKEAGRSFQSELELARKRGG